MTDTGAAGFIDSSAAPEAPEAAAIYRIWPGDGIGPGSEDWTWQQSTMTIPWSVTDRRLSRNVVSPSLTLFRPDPARANGTAIVIAPGGAFHFLMIDHEGYEMARWLAERGVTAFVLKYRLGRTPDADADLLDFRNDLQRRLAESRTGTVPSDVFPLDIRTKGEDDGRQAIRFVREHAAEWNIDPTRIGIAGFSAGGGVAMGPVHEHDALSRPDFAACIYGAHRDLEVPADAPPLFIAIADDDTSVPPLSALRLYEGWQAAGKPAELHVFGNGAHGFGMTRTGLLSDPWIDLFGAWMGARGLLTDTR